MKKRVVVTGSTGFLGRHLVRRLLAEPNLELFGFNRKNDGVLPTTHFLSGDLLEADLGQWFEGIRPQVVFHVVGTSPKAPFAHQLQVHAEGTRRMLQALVDAGAHPKVIVVGSAAEYGLRDEPVDENAVCRPEGEYGIAKLAQTQVALAFARRYNLPVMVGRVFNVYGHTERNLVIAALAAQLARAEAVYPKASQLQVQNLRSWRDFIHVDDAVEALVRLSRLESHTETSGQIYNIASGHSTATSTLLDMLKSYSRLDDEALKKVELKIQGIQKEDISWADISKIREHTGWEPAVTLEEGLRRELNYWRSREGMALTAGER